MLRPRIAIRSYILVFYLRGEVVRRYQLPIAMAAPFVNRLLREVIGVAVTEPSYLLQPRLEVAFERSPRPLGHTSLWADEYVPERAPELSLFPEAKVRSFEVRVFDFHHELFHGHYSTDDVFLHAARQLLDHSLAEGKVPTGKDPYYYAIQPSEEPVHTVPGDVFPDDAYEAEGVFRLPPRQDSEPRILFRPVPEPPLQVSDAARFGPSRVHGKGGARRGRTVLPDHVFTDLHQRLPLRRDIEEGGYVLGNVFRQQGSPEAEGDPDFRWLVEVTDLVMAESTIGSPVQLLFTGDTWSKLSRRRDRDYAGRRLVGWFHTHLFPADDTFGLSQHDHDLHAWYMPRPWHVALLLNLERDGRRAVRCYQRDADGELAEAPFEVLDGEAV